MQNKNLIKLLTFCMIIFSVSAFAKEEPSQAPKKNTNFLITEDSIGPIKIGMTIGEVKKILPGWYGIDLNADPEWGNVSCSISSPNESYNLVFSTEYLPDGSGCDDSNKIIKITINDKYQRILPNAKLTTEIKPSDNIADYFYNSFSYSYSLDFDRNNFYFSSQELLHFAMNFSSKEITIGDIRKLLPKDWVLNKTKYNDNFRCSLTNTVGIRFDDLSFATKSNTCNDTDIITSLYKSSETLVSQEEKLIGSVYTFGMKIGDLKKKLPGSWVAEKNTNIDKKEDQILYNINDCLIATSKTNKGITLQAEILKQPEDSQKSCDDNKIISTLEIVGNGKNLFKTKEGIGTGSLISDAEKVYGKAKILELSDSRPSDLSFERKPPKIEFQMLNRFNQEEYEKGSKKARIRDIFVNEKPVIYTE